jgi:tetratricopeptide (TPR) repeat protein
MPTPLADLLHLLAAAQSAEQLAALLPQFDAPAPGDDPGQHMFYKGLVQFKLQSVDALASFEHSIALNPALPDAHLYYAISVPSMPAITRHKALALQREHLQLAIALAERLYAPTPQTWMNYLICLNLYAGVCSGIGPYAQVEYAYRQILKVEPRNFAALNGLANALIDQGKANDIAGLTEVRTIFEAALAIDPAQQLIIDSLETVTQSIALLKNNPRARKIGRYPDTSEMQGDVGEVIRRYITNQIPRIPFISAQTRFTTMGSCFASEISKKLQARGYTSTHFEVSEFVNSTYANRFMVDWALGECEGQPKERLDELFAGINITPADLLDYWTNADVLVYTLGVAPAFFEKGTRNFIMPKGSALNARALAERYEFRTTDVAENLDNLDYIYSRIRSFNVNPHLKFVITLSPVPLKASFEFESAMFADCLSKSTLRVVAHEFIKTHGTVLYWPSFEIVKWLGAHVGPFYGTDDGASWHISEDLVHVITDLFIEHFSTDA